MYIVEKPDRGVSVTVCRFRSFFNVYNIDFFSERYIYKENVSSNIEKDPIDEQNVCLCCLGVYFPDWYVYINKILKENLAKKTSNVGMKVPAGCAYVIEIYNVIPLWKPCEYSSVNNRIFLK